MNPSKKSSPVIIFVSIYSSLIRSYVILSVCTSQRTITSSHTIKLFSKLSFLQKILLNSLKWTKPFWNRGLIDYEAWLNNYEANFFLIINYNACLIYNWANSSNKRLRCPSNWLWLKSNKTLPNYLVIIN